MQLMCRIEWLQDCPDTSICKAGTTTVIYEVRHKNETKPIAREPIVGGERQTDGYRICSDLSQCYKAQLDRFTQCK